MKEQEFKDLQIGDMVMALSSQSYYGENYIREEAEYQVLGKEENNIIFANDLDEYDSWHYENFDLVKKIKYDVGVKLNVDVSVENTQEDMVSHPKHYKECSLESIEIMQLLLGKDGVINFCLGNCYKYLHRHLHKGKPEEDLKKAMWYIDKAVELDKQLLYIEKTEPLEKMVKLKLEELDNEK